MTYERTALVLGATGGIGGEIARQLRNAGWNVRALRRTARPPGADDAGIAWIAGDALNRSDVICAARGASVLVHAVNPPGYRKWSDLVLPMLDNTIAAAAANCTTVVLPGTVYNYGPDAFPVLTESSPQRPTTRKGVIRVAMEERLRSYALQGGRSLIVRAGDFFGPKARSNWFSQGLVKPGAPIRTIYNPAAAGVAHQWAYIPDVGRTVIELLARSRELDSFATFHMAGHLDTDGTQMAAAIQRVVARQTGAVPRITTFPWWALTLASPFNPTFREIQEMRYLWKHSVTLDNTRLRGTLGREPHTALNEAVEATLRGLGCLGDSRSETLAPQVSPKAG